jgi:hypothetical protein
MYEGCSEPFDYFTIKVRYRVGKQSVYSSNNFWDLFFSSGYLDVSVLRDKEEDVFEMIFPHEKLWPMLSQRLRVKMKNIQSDYEYNVVYKIDVPFNDTFKESIKLNRKITSIYITDKVWSREHKLKTILDA